MTREEYTQILFQHYQLVTVLSERNHGKVFRLRHKTLQKDLVLRLLPHKVEAYDALLNLQCPNLPEVYDVIPLEDGYAILEEFIDGLSLSEMMEAERCSRRTVRSVMLGLCNAMSVLHSRGIVHRDIKPENVIIQSDKRIVLVDLNISRIEKQVKKDTFVMGSVGYASPEQLGIAQSDARTDIYACGILLNVMVTGKHPCECLASGRMGRIVKKCTNVNPDLRYSSALQLARSL